MKRFTQWLLLALILSQAPLAHCLEKSDFSFGVIAKQDPTDSGDTPLRQILAESDADNLAFVVMNGVKPADGDCSDDTYVSRRSMLDRVKNGLIISLTAEDWALCSDAQNRSIATERINLLRELFFADEFSLGDSKIALQRQSVMPKFRTYAENTRWRIGDVMFATINLPSNNNNYLVAAGRNSEFEDRQVANSDWLKRIFMSAKIARLRGVVIFVDRNPLAQSDDLSMFSSTEKWAAFSQIRRQIIALSTKFDGKILLVHAEPSNSSPPEQTGIKWQGNIGLLYADSPWTKVIVTPGRQKLFETKKMHPSPDAR